MARGMEGEAWTLDGGGTSNGPARAREARPQRLAKRAADARLAQPRCPPRGRSPSKHCVLNAETTFHRGGMEWGRGMVVAWLGRGMAMAWGGHGGNHGGGMEVARGGMEQAQSWQGGEQGAARIWRGRGEMAKRCTTEYRRRPLVSTRVLRAAQAAPCARSRATAAARNARRAWCPQGPLLPHASSA